MYVVTVRRSPVRQQQMLPDADGHLFFLSVPQHEDHVLGNKSGQQQDILPVVVLCPEGGGQDVDGLDLASFLQARNCRRGDGACYCHAAYIRIKPFSLSCCKGEFGEDGFFRQRLVYSRAVRET